MKLVLLAAACAFLVSKPAAAADKVVVCYYASWTCYRTGYGKFDVQDIDTSLCTHINYAFVGLNPDGSVFIIDPWQSNDDGLRGFRRLVALKKQNPSLKIILSMGGWNEGSAKYSRLAANPTLRKKLAQNVVKTLAKYDFDGFDLDWEYPGSREGSNPRIDKDDFTCLLYELKEAFKPKGYLLTAAVAAAQDKIDIGYDVPTISKYLDLINVMTYDYHGHFDSYVGHVAPLYGCALDKGGKQNMNVNASISYWIEKGADPSKLTLGIAAYGRSFTLADPYQTSLYSPISGGGNPGPYTASIGTLGYNEICQLYSDWEYRWDDEQKVPHRVSGNQWVGYEDEKSVRLKADFAKEKNLAGMMVWSFDTDDFRGICGEPYPILRAINDGLRDKDYAY